MGHGLLVASLLSILYMFFAVAVQSDCCFGLVNGILDFFPEVCWTITHFWEWSFLALPNFYVFVYGGFVFWLVCGSYSHYSLCLPFEGCGFSGGVLLVLNYT